MMVEIIKQKTVLKKGRFTITEYHTLDDVYYMIHYFQSWFFPIGFPLTEKRYREFSKAHKDMLKAIEIRNG